VTVGVARRTITRIREHHRLDDRGAAFRRDPTGLDNIGLQGFSNRHAAMTALRAGWAVGSRTPTPWKRMSGSSAAHCAHRAYNSGSTSAINRPGAMVRRASLVLIRPGRPVAARVAVRGRWISISRLTMAYETLCAPLRSAPCRPGSLAVRTVFPSRGPRWQTVARAARRYWQPCWDDCCRAAVNA
jgi:hypothetical protein